jgi:hypothetical protein
MLVVILTEVVVRDRGELGVDVEVLVEVGGEVVGDEVGLLSPFRMVSRVIVHKRHE